MLGLKKLAKQVFGTPNERRIKAMRPIIDRINALETDFEALSDEGLIEKTDALKLRLSGALPLKWWLSGGATVGGTGRRGGSIRLK